MSEQLLRDLDSHLNKTLDHVKMELASIRAGRATASLVEDVKVDAYETKMALKEVASITTPEPTLILVHPWDKSLVKAVEKAVANSGKGLTAVVDGDVLRISLPALSSDRREELAKLAREKGEEGQVALRNVRHEIMEALEKEELSEDEEKRMKKQVDEKVQQASENIKSLVDAKQKDILSL